MLDNLDQEAPPVRQEVGDLVDQGHMAHQALESREVAPLALGPSEEVPWVQESRGDPLVGGPSAQESHVVP
jgi:diadenosine tetraphosphatase ApaH/serine/threonine PP2A family protein phosphatase